MPAWNDNTKREVDFEKAFTLLAGQTIQILVNGVEVMGATVPASKKVRGWICVRGEVENA